MDNVQEQMNKAVAQVATNYGAVYVSNIKKALAAKDKLATGALYQSIESNVFIDNDIVHLEILSLEYLKWIDLGRKPGSMPPVQKILAWVQARELNPNPKATVRRNEIGRFSRGFHVHGAENQLSVAWAIAKSIQKLGIKKVPIYNVNDKTYVDMQQEATTEAARVASEYLGLTFAEAARSLGLQIITT